jgi:hypothetical protein
MPSNPDSQINFRSAAMAEHLDGYEGRQRRNQVAKICLERYQLLVQDGLRKAKLMPDEAIAVWQSLNGVNTSHPEMLPILYQGMLNELRESCPSAYEIAACWTLADFVAVVDACDRVGGGEYHIENLEDELKRVGLCA